MFKKEPEGYKKLLVYQKASQLHEDILKLTIQFPRVKKFFELEDQMNRSGRSGPKNIAEGWKRNTTKEYFDFLGFAIASVDEVKGDAEDIILGKYPELMGIKGIMGEKGVRGRELAKEIIGQEENPIRDDGSHSLYSPYTHSSLQSHLVSSISSEQTVKGLMSQQQLDMLKFYPLDTTLPPIVQIYLKAKEVNLLIYRLQQSLDIKMDKEGTKPTKDKFKDRLAEEREADKAMEQMFRDLGMVQLPDGRFVSKSTGDKIE